MRPAGGEAARGAPAAFRFGCAAGPLALSLARALDSLVRVSRRVGRNRLAGASGTRGTRVAAPRRLRPRARGRDGAARVSRGAPQGGSLRPRARPAPLGGPAGGFRPAAATPRSARPGSRACGPAAERPGGATLGWEGGQASPPYPRVAPPSERRRGLLGSVRFPLDDFERF